MINLKACSRCGGDLLAEELLGEVDLVCLQCGHRSAAPMQPTSAYTITRRPRLRQNQKLAA